MGSSARLGHPPGLGPGLRSPYLIQSSEFYRRGESTQTAPSKGHAAIEPSHDMKGHRILKEPRIQHPSPFPLYLRRDEGHPTDVSVGLRSCCPLTAIPVPELGSIVRVRVPTNRRFLPTRTIIAVRGAAVRIGWCPRSLPGWRRIKASSDAYLASFLLLDLGAKRR